MMDSVEAAIADIKAGKMVILIDDEDRENEGDLCMAAELVTPDAINFMAKFGRGLICLSLTPERVNHLNLHMMSAENTSSFGTAFTVSIEARKGVTTGISAKDRARTILTAIDAKTKPEDLARPGHVFPLRARPGGVLQRAGQTEGSVDLARLAGLIPAGVICEIMNDDGTMSRVPELKTFAETHNLKIVTIEDLIKYRLRNDRLIQRVAEVKLPTSYGDFNAIAYESMVDKSVHMALVKGDLHTVEPVLVRVHSECLTGDVFGSKRCDCGDQLHRSMELINTKGRGVVLYMRQEGRGIGLANKIKAYALQDSGMDTVEANIELGFKADLRDYGIGAQILVDLGLTDIVLITNNPRKIVGLEGYGLKVVDRYPIEVKPCEKNIVYLKTKKKKLGHMLDEV
ncbi:MAG: bifunctional 3,4-dihydroxy-2-butanone-4-phosphate synthase/GTP cyclohydrolase II [Nitrospirae bacterium]|nr:bifunctional 3,4-dihydroxy-2-butanone-4-phosphate synthase/GTP cyclohydrolase II [Nitrospirota bacterium]MBF0535302.1 bifunctional 3,4-dihydroxy-2-butanone-4-phosphate synthase/GTP cyclohydrolase II [Nitrospirota bacterium]MBF0617275.1 bifunctional 3,4-dihydroxy-2-butanone-4-phosphate synthase/GTP cyclohydrolase II [Nitrospirota bacterium]